MDKQQVKEWTKDWILSTRGLQGKYRRAAEEAEARGDIGHRDRCLQDAFYIDKNVLAPVFWLPLIAFVGLLIWNLAR